MADQADENVRDLRLAKAIKIELVGILGGAADPRLQSVEIVRVESRQKGNHVLVVFGPPEEIDDEVGAIEGPEEIQTLLVKARGWLRSELVSSLNLKSVPDLSFAADPVLWAGWR